MAGEIEQVINALSPRRLEPVLTRLAKHAELDPEQRRAFQAWTGAMIDRLTAPTSVGLAGLREGLESVRAEFRALHAGVAAGWLARGHIDLELVSRRAFLAHVIDVVEPLVGHEPNRARMVKAAA